jgi:hypothetical protein
MCNSNGEVNTCRHPASSSMLVTNPKHHHVDFYHDFQLVRQNTHYSNAFVNRHFSVDNFGMASRYRGLSGPAFLWGCMLLIPSTISRTVFLGFHFD